MTVPMWFGWEAVAGVVVALLVAGVVFLLIGAARTGAGQRDEWRALLEARSAHRPDRAGHLDRDQPLHRYSGTYRS